MASKKAQSRERARSELAKWRHPTVVHSSRQLQEEEVERIWRGLKSHCGMTGCGWMPGTDWQRARDSIVQFFAEPFDAAEDGNVCNRRREPLR